MPGGLRQAAPDALEHRALQILGKPNQHPLSAPRFLPPSSLCPLMRCLRRTPPVRSNAPAARGQAGLQPSPVQGPNPRKCQRNHQAFQVNWKLIGLVFRFSGHMRDAQQLNYICYRITLLLGPPGCGKTTLLKALTGRLNKSLKVCVVATDHNSPCIIVHLCYTVPSLYVFFLISNTSIKLLIWSVQGLQAICKMRNHYQLHLVPFFVVCRFRNCKHIGCNY